MPETNPTELDKKIRVLLRRALIQCPLNRAEVCDRLTKAGRRKVAEGMLDNWCADTKTQWHLPADLVPTICELAKDDGIQRELLSDRMLLRLKVGEFVMDHSSLFQHFERELQRTVFIKLYGKKEGLRGFRAARQMFGPARTQQRISK